MKHRKTKPNGPWGKRVDNLISACGWRQAEWQKHFGFSAQAVRRVCYGGRPKVRFILQLRKLEQGYAAELDALAKGLIVTRGRTRYCRIGVPARDIGVGSKR